VSEYLTLKQSKLSEFLTKVAKVTRFPAKLNKCSCWDGPPMAQHLSGARGGEIMLMIGTMAQTKIGFTVPLADETNFFCARRVCLKNQQRPSPTPNSNLPKQITIL
jgi:hypothetical protein